MILHYCVDGKEFSETKLVNLITACWEGCLFEWLKSIGHGMNSCYADPKLTTMKVIRRGLFNEGKDPFTPHYICKRVAPRYDWVQSADIAPKLASLRTIENLVKKTEADVMKEDDYSNVLFYLQKMHELRRQENEYRDFVSNELEIARAKVDRAESNEKMATEMLQECETRYIQVATKLNKEVR